MDTILKSSNLDMDTCWKALFYFQTEILREELHSHIVVDFNSDKTLLQELLGIYNKAATDIDIFIGRVNVPGEWNSLIKWEQKFIE